jgi:hypothetical protein
MRSRGVLPLPPIAALLVAALLAVGLGGCALNGGSGSSAIAARESLYDVLDATQAALGGAWDNQDDPTPRGCVIPLWKNGTQYPALRVGPAPQNAKTAVAKVSRLWRNRGFSLTTAVVGHVIQVQGKNKVSALLILRVSDEATTLQGQSECRPSAN